MRRWVDVATLVKAKGSEGRLVARKAASLPFMIQPGTEVAFVPPRLDVLRHAVATASSTVDGVCYEVFFDQVGDRDSAEALVGCHCLIRREKIDGAFFEREPVTWTGWEVADEEGAVLGTLSAVTENPGQALLEVKRPDGRTLLVPFVDEIVLYADASARSITVRLPLGLLDL